MTALLPASAPHEVLALLAADRVRPAYDAIGTAAVNWRLRGAVATRAAGHVRRAVVAGSGRALILEARSEGAGLAVEVWGPPDTAGDDAEDALAAASRWLGLRDDVTGFAEAAARHPVTRRLHARLGDVRLSRLPAVGEAFGRAVIGQLVQMEEGIRSAAKLAARIGTPAPYGLHAWPTRAQVGSAPAWVLRRCGISLRGATALHAGAVAERRLTEALADRPLLDRRLRALPGVGAWTSAETRLALGDGDAISVGDYHLPDLVGHALRGGAGDGPGGRWTDAAMLELLAPFPGHRGRIIQLVSQGVRAGLIPRRGRRAPRAALSAHRYW